ncbi:MAG TPA: ribonuclease domain-containing protein [Rhodocyclaceae bacterium]|jgi:ribonuclease T1|nr:ribonuclease domain-containing protein [Rhodocyclaceae bacterium]
MRRLLSLLLSVWLLCFAGLASAYDDSITVATLPPEARTTLQLIDAGGPFPYRRDGVVFGNYERRLPVRARGYYHEYTVPTPGVKTRGARRIIAGTEGERYYTADHYNSFRRIIQ